MSQQFSYPKVGQSVHDENRADDPNGIITLIDRESSEAMVKFENTYTKKFDFESIQLDDLRGNWTDKFGGCWFISKA